MAAHAKDREAEIRAVIEDWAEGIRRKDAARVIAQGTQDFLHFSLAPPLISGDTGARGLNQWFDTWQGPLVLDITELSITADETVAFATSINRLHGTKKEGGGEGLWFRQTLGLRKEAGAWKISHLHESVPFYMDGSMRAAVDLKP